MCVHLHIHIHIYTTFARDRARRRAHIRPGYGHLHLYTDVLGTEIWRTPSTRLDLRLFNSSACQKHQCTLCSLIVLFPFLSFLPPASLLSLSLFHILFLSLTPILCLSLSFSLSLFPVYPFSLSLSFVSVSLPPSRFSVSRLLESSLFPDFPSSFGVLPFVRGRSLRPGERLGAIRCDNCP